MKNNINLDEFDFFKLLLYVLAFIGICALLILFLFLPILKEYRANSIRLNSQNYINNNMYNKLTASQARLRALQEENNISLSQMQTPFNEEKFMSLLQKHFKNVNLKFTQDTQKQDSYYDIEGYIANPKEFYAFIEDLKQYESVLKISYPLELKGDNENIKIAFSVSIISKN